MVVSGVLFHLHFSKLFERETKFNFYCFKRVVIFTGIGMDGSVEHIWEEMDVIQQGTRGILNLPYEVIEHIFRDTCLGHMDIRNLMLTCQKFREVGRSNGVWKSKLDQRYYFSKEMSCLHAIADPKSVYNKTFIREHIHLI